MTTGITDPRMIDTAEGGLAVRSLGGGAQTLVLWPSIFTDHRIHLGLARKLAATTRLVLIDGPGHGQSGAGPGQADMAAFARGMAGVMDGLGLHRAVVGGTSWGGMVGAELAISQPDPVAGVVMMNTPQFIDGSRPGLRARMIAPDARYFLGSRSFRDGVARSFFAPESLPRDPALAEGFHAMLRGADAMALSASVRAVILHGRPLADRQDQIAAPVLMIAEREDAIYPLPDQHRAAARLRDGRRVVVPGRHISAVDAPDAVAEALAAFLAGLL